MRVEYSWEVGVSDQYFDDNDNEITAAEYNRLVKIDEQKKTAEQKRRKFDYEMEQVGKEIKKLTTETFHTLLIKYKETKCEEDYAAIGIPLYHMTKRLADKYIKKLPLRCKQMYLCDCNINDYTEYLTVVMLKAIDYWQPNFHSKDGSVLVVKFQTLYEIFVKRFAAKILRRYNTDYSQENVTSIASLDAAVNSENILGEISKHFVLNNQNEIDFDLHLRKFKDVLRKIDKDLPVILSLLMANYSHSSIAEDLDCTTKTIQRKKKIIAEQWLQFNRVN